ncbi:alanine racemase [Thermotoga sp. Ku-13t]|uniref:YggS family pyridoxal phosphate-dependent enzyme n=1 Tax=Thermotoga sp. Ku-13t TaxID=1755813 RepID=UPI0013ED87D9|nr:YggS family pyridoxal phosphate-dependent enzyme [Thermotoga sp. Ku-13t]KAF2958788.1 alanine racemase [Thermotoga sp. Ku-13t]
MDIQQNLQRIKERIAQAALRAHRDPDSVRLVVVVKEASLEQIIKLRELGVEDFGENYAQQLVKKYESVPDATWHFIGRIQTNKIKYIVPRCEYIHSVCRREEIVEIERVASKLKKRQKILIEVNVSGEETKAGVEQGSLSELLTFSSNFPHVEVIGLMTMAPLVEDAEQVRWVFRRLRELRDELVDRWPNVVHLSMGMTNDFEVAIEEGATMVRIGRAILKGE